jgi:hypothetical protein
MPEQQHCAGDRHQWQHLWESIALLSPADSAEHLSLWGCVVCGQAEAVWHVQGTVTDNERWVIVRRGARARWHEGRERQRDPFGMR